MAFLHFGKCSQESDHLPGHKSNRSFIDNASWYEPAYQKALTSQKGKTVPTYTADGFFCVTGTRAGTGSKQNTIVPTANVVIIIDDDQREEASPGEGSWDAITKAVERATKTELRLISDGIKVRVLNENGTAARGRVELRLKVNGKETTGNGESHDTTEAFFFALVDGLNNALGETSKESTEQWVWGG